MKPAKKKRAVRKARLGAELPEAAAPMEAVAAEPPARVDVEAAAPVRESRLVKLPASCTLRETAELKAALLAADGDVPVTLDAADVERVDTAALQVLASFVRARVRRGVDNEWRASNETFLQAVRLLGLTAQLGVPSTPAG